MRLIDADKLKVNRCDDSASRATFDYIYEDDVEDAPTIDLVRCGECEWYDKDFKDCNIRDSYGWEYKPTDFCSYGERRADGNKRRSV